MTQPNRSVLVVENEALLRDLIAKVLETQGFLVHSAGSAIEAKKLVDKFDPDALVIDIDLGLGPNGFDLAEAVQTGDHGRAIVFLTNLPDPRFIEGGEKRVTSGAAYLRKSALVDSNLLVEALEATLRERVSIEHRHDLSDSRPFSEFSESQLQVLKLIATGKSNAQIAEVRGTSIRAVEAVVTRVLQQLGIDGSTEGNPRVEAANAYFTASGTRI